ncbi:MAG TPA: hypothetical protein VNG90_03630 [Candidatus Acidoferrum sp.]|nr:hypothetical protein [Candidatus Acidoferrum sp.]
MFEFARRLKQNTFLRHNAIYFVGSLSIGFLNYLFYPVLGRVLRPDAFGEVQVLASLFLQIGIFLNVLGLLTVNIVANYDNPAKRNRMISELERLAALIGVVLLAITVAAGSLLKDFFHFGTTLPFILMIVALVVSVPLAFRSAYLRGIKRFSLVAWIGIIASVSDLLLAAALARAGFGSSGVMLGLVLAQVAAFGYAANRARRHGFAEVINGHFLRLPDFKLLVPELKYALLVLIGSLVMTGMYSLDTVVVKHYFDARTAGLYAGISTVARIIFFLTASVAQVLLPSIKLQHSARDNRQTLLKSVGLLLLIGGGVSAVFAALPQIIIRVLMGATYLPYAYLLPRLGFVLLAISLLNLFVMYFLALRRFLIAPVVIAGIIATLVLIGLDHHSLVSIINDLLYGTIIMFGLLGAWCSAAQLGKLGYNGARP